MFLFFAEQCYSASVQRLKPKPKGCSRVLLVCAKADPNLPACRVIRVIQPTDAPTLQRAVCNGAALSSPTARFGRSTRV
jgi:hypothetical protein